MSAQEKLILHVEDDVVMQEYIDALLPPKVKVIHANTLKSAKELLQQNTFDLALIDLTLPDGSGTEIIRELHTKHPNVTVVVFSSHEITDTMFGVDRVFVKGRFKQDDLIATINN